MMEEPIPSRELFPLTVVISRDEVERGMLAPALSVLNGCLTSVEMMLARFEQLDLAFQGYDHDRREVFEVPEIRNFVAMLDAEFAFWLFFMSKKHLGLQAVTLCLMPPYLTERGKKTVLVERLDRLLAQRWWPAMNHICEAVGFSEAQIEELSERVTRYLTQGRL